MKSIMRLVAVAGMAAAVVAGTGTTASAQPVGVQAEGEVSCGYKFNECWLKWHEYWYEKSYIVSKIYYKGGGYYFYWWN